MAVTYAGSGSLELLLSLLTTLSGDQVGGVRGSLSISKVFGPNSGEIQLSGYLYGEPVCAAGDWLLAHASDPFQAMGDAGYSPGLTVASKKLKALLIYNDDATQSITISRGNTNGLPIFGAADDAVTIQPGGLFFLLIPTGTAALTTGSNDKVTIAVSGGTPRAKVLAAYGT